MVCSMMNSWNVCGGFVADVDDLIVCLQLLFIAASCCD
jgi:hypothetical protein